MDGERKSERYVARVPMMAAGAAFAAGIAAQRFLFHPVWLWLTAAILLGCAAFVLRVRIVYIAYATALVAIVCVGAFVAEAREAAPGVPATLARAASGEPVIVTGTVMRDGALHKSGFGGDAETVDLAVERVESGDQSTSVSGGARVTIYVPRKNHEPEEDEDSSGAAATTLPIYRYGQRLRLTAKLHPPRNYRNPGAFDYAGYLEGIGIEVLGSSKLESIELLPGEGGTRFERWRWAARRRVLKQIHQLWPVQQAALFDAMVLGERGLLTHDTREEFQRSGTYHILVVSGMNVGIFAVAIYWLLRRVRAGVGSATMLTILMAVGYALLTDLGAPILRSLLMLSVYQISRMFYRDRAALNVVGVAAVAMLAWEPRQLFDPSFQLTFLSVAAIAGICVPLLERTTEPYRAALRQLEIQGYDQAFSPKLAQWRIELRMIEERLGRILGLMVGRWLTVSIPAAGLALFELALVSATMQVVLALPMVWYFHRLPFRGFWANLAVVPLTGVLMPACVLAVVLSFGSLWLAKVPAIVAGSALAAITGTVHMLGRGGVHDARIARPEAVVILACAAAIIVAMLTARRKRAFAAAGIAALVVTTLWIALPRTAEARAHVLEVTAIDVGQGESLLIVTPEGKTLLLDAGGQLGFSESDFDIGEEVTSSYLWARGIDHLDAVAYSHAHSDHLQGMSAVIANFRPKEIWTSGAVENAQTRRVEQACEEYGVPVVKRARGDRWNFGGAEFEVLAAQTAEQVNPKVLDDSSMVMRVRVENTSMLLTGDAHKKVEDEYANSVAQSDVLKVAHHGSSTSTSQELLDAVRPRFALISVGRGNSFGHPRMDVLRRLAAAHVHTYRTDLFGPVTFYLDGERVTPSVLR